MAGRGSEVELVETRALVAAALRGNESQRSIGERLGVSRHFVRQVAADLKATSVATHTRAPAVLVKGLSGRQSADRPGRARAWGGLIDRMIGGDTGALVGVEGELLDPDAFGRLNIRKLVDIAVGASPEINRALWDFLRMFVSGYEVEVYKAGTQEVDPQGEMILNDFRDMLAWKDGDESVLYRRLGTAAWMRGAMIMELVMDDAGRFPVGIATPDPAAFSFKLVEGEWQIGQWQAEKWVPMDRPTFRHVQIDPRPGRPEGRAPVSSALFPALFLLGIMQDLRRVIANQGYPRLDVEISVEMLSDLMEGTNGVPKLFEDGTDLTEVLETISSGVHDSLGDVGPGDAYVHGSHVKMNSPIGAVGGDLRGITEVIAALERMSVRSLKTSPAFFGITEGAGESTANRQWEQLVSSVESMQRPAEKLIESIYEMTLQAYGRNCDVKFRFAKIRATEELRDEQTRTAKIGNVKELMAMGMLTPEQAAEELTGEVGPAVTATYGEDAGGSAVGYLPDGATVQGGEVPSTDALGLDGERSVPGSRILPVVASRTSVSTVDETGASADFDRTVPKLAGILEADPA